jgi:hypothetical protein
MVDNVLLTREPQERQSQGHLIIKCFFFALKVAYVVVITATRLLG